jgi:hypothetical protein
MIALFEEAKEQPFFFLPTDNQQNLNSY